MLSRTGYFLAETMKRWIPDPFVFALLITLLTGAMAYFTVGSTPTQLVDAWYKGFWILLEFGMQMILILATGYCIALSRPVSAVIDKLVQWVGTPTKVYMVIMVFGGLFALISWSWVVLTAIFAKELAKRVRGVDYAYLTACVYLSFTVWVCGLSSSIPLLLNTQDNFLIKAGLLDSTIAIEHTLGSSLNYTLICLSIISMTLLMVALRPKGDQIIEADNLTDDTSHKHICVAEEALQHRLSHSNFSDSINSSTLLQLTVSFFGLWYIGRYFVNNGFDINLNIMIFIFIIVGMLSHRTPIRYVLAMKRACSNVSGVIFQFPFYAGIMGLMMFTGLAKAISAWMTAGASVESLPVIAYLSGAIVNFAIPSAGGEWAVIGPSFIESAKALGADMTPVELDSFLSRIALSVAYGEAATNLLQPFFLLLILPVMGAGIKIQARDVMGHLVIPCAVTMLLGIALVTFMPL